MTISWIDGVWTGVGFQITGTHCSVWKIKFTANEGENEYFIEYPTLGSSGVWKLLEKESAAERYTFEESILIQNGNTMNGGKVVVTKVSDNYMSFSFFMPPFCEAVIACSTLKRKPTVQQLNMETIWH